MAQSEQQLISSRGRSVRRGKVFVLRMAESFFRRWPLYLLPIILFVGLGVVKAKAIPKTYLSAGSVNVSSSSFLSDLTSSRTPDVGYETPAVKTARDINERLGSDTFAKLVAETAGLGTALSSGVITLDYIRTHVSAAAAGDTLLRVASTTDDPERSQRLASSLISTYTQYVIGVSVADSNTAKGFYTDQIAAHRADVEKAKAALLAYLSAHPAPVAGRTELEALAVTNLQDAVTAAQALVDDDQAKLDQATLQVASASAEIGQRLSVADEPARPTAPQPTKSKQAFTLAIFLLLGVIVVAVALILAGLLDHTVRSADDVTEATGLDVVATIPVRKRSNRSGSKQPSAELSAGAA